MTTHIVGKPFEFNGRTLDAGERVDASGWRNREALVKGRFLRETADGTPMRFAVVCKPFSGLESGALVDTATWPNTDALVACRFIRAATDAELDQATAPPVDAVPAGGKKGRGR